jgi:glucose-1-phosphate cytidylyltransferase
MKAVILAGGLGTRISEETHLKPKPMIEIGGKPILWHIMKLYSAHGVNDFVICCGYKGYVIKEYFANYFLHMSDVTFDMEHNKMEVHQRKAEPWRVTLVDTGDETLTGGRLKRVADYVKDEEAFCFTYGDGVSDVDISREIAFHKQHGKLATVTAVQPPGRYGALQMNGTKVAGFTEKPRGDGGLINGGFFVLSPKCIDLIAGDQSSWEAEPLTQLASEGQLMAYAHNGFWQPMDTLRDKTHLKNCGRLEKRRGKCGNEPGILAWQAGFFNRTHGLQGRLAGIVANRHGRRSLWLCTGTTNRTQLIRGRKPASTFDSQHDCRHPRRSHTHAGYASRSTRHCFTSGRATAGALFLCCAGGDLFRQRHGYSQPAGSGAPNTQRQSGG